MTVAEEEIRMATAPEHDSLEQVASEVRVCTLCELSRSRTHAVPGEGNPKARVMLVGEGPGWHEDQQGKPFVGASGKFLTELIGHAGLQREDVFITNVVKCRPPGNRDPLPDEIHACSGYLDRQVDLIDPDVIVTLGRFSMSRYFPGERISRIHGQAKEIGNRLVVPMYHPAAALHQGALKETIIEDFAKLPKLLADRERARESAREKGESATQSSLF
jgi:uracil-DNA glycosylase family 4